MTAMSRSRNLLSLLITCLAAPAIAESDTAPSFDRKARIGDLLFVKGVTISNLSLPGAIGGNINPSINDGELSDYSFDPARLPPGLAFDRFTRVLSGTPASSFKKRTYHLWVHDDDENWATGDGDSLRFTIEVRSEDSPNKTLARDTVGSSGGQATSPYPAEFSASFETEFQWFNRDRLPSFSSTAAWSQPVWRGERVQRQILVAGAAPQERLSITMSDLRTQNGDVIPANAATFRYPKFVIGDIEARDCEGFPERSDVSFLADALANEPEDGLPRFYPSMIWLSIDVPDGARPANYAAKITISSESGDHADLEVLLQVTPWQMPPVSERQFHLDLWQFPVSILDRFQDANPVFSPVPWSATHYELLEPFYRYLAQMGQRAVTTYIKEGTMGAPSMIRWIASENGKTWAFDYSAFDRHVEQLAIWGIDGQIDAFSTVGWNRDEIPFWDEATGEYKVFHAPVGSPLYNALWNNFLTDFKNHLREKGWFEKTVLYMDEVPQEQMEAAIALIRYNDEQWKIGLAYGHAPDDRVIRSLYDVSGYYESEVEVRTYDHQLTTFYTSCSLRRPNNYVAADADPADMAALPWYAMARGHHGYLRWAFDNWKSFDPLDLRDGQFTAGDFSFVYRSSNELDMTVIPSVRSELLRDGIEDFEKLIVLKNRLARCADRELLSDLEEAIDAFTTVALMEGRAEQLLARGRASLRKLSLGIDPLDCPG